MLLAWISARSYGITDASRTYLRTEMPLMDAESLRWLWAAIDAYDGTKWLGHITCPTWVVVTGRNRRTHRQAGRMVRLVPAAQLHVVATQDTSSILMSPKRLRVYLPPLLALRERHRLQTKAAASSAPRFEWRVSTRPSPSG